MKFCLILASALAVASCASGSETNQVQGRNANEVSSVEAAWLKDWNARDVDRVLARYGSNAMVKFVPAKAMIGKQAIRAGVAPFLADPNFHIQFGGADARTRRSGGLASTSGRYTVQYTDPVSHKPAVETGSYVTVWEQQKDGDWQAVEDITSADPSG